MSKPENVSNFRRRIKLALVESFGNKCKICGNSFPQSVYDFHHLNPAEKKFGIGSGGITRAQADVAEEAKKCIMVCANCHRLIEHEDYDLDGLISDFDEDKYYSYLKELVNKNKKVVEKKENKISKKPDREILKKQIRTLPFLQIGKLYDVSDNAVRKWCKSYDLPSRVSDIKIISDEEWKKI